MRAEIATKQAMHALVRLHAELGGKIDSNKREAERLANSMKHLEAVIAMLSPGFDIRRIAVKRRNRKNRWFKRGTMFRAVLGVLKGAKGPLTVREITTRLLADRGEADPDPKTIRQLEGGIRATLLSKRGRTVARVGQGMPARWVISLPQEQHQ
jgi:hypothetical protein